MTHADAFAFAPDEEDQHHGRNQDVHAEESANPSGEEFPKEKSQRHAVPCHNPRHKLPVGQCNPEKTKDQVNSFAFHGRYSSQQWSPRMFARLAFCCSYSLAALMRQIVRHWRGRTAVDW